jgi:hypothetical protein
MKKILISISVLLLWSSICLGQDKIAEKEQSNLEKFSAKSGTLLEKKFIDIGFVKTVKMQVLTFTDLISNAKVSGVRFEYESGARYSSSKLAFLDKDEVDGLIKSIDLLKAKVFLTTPATYTEVVFTSRSGFMMACYFSDGKWTPIVQIKRFDTDSLVSLKLEDLDILLENLKSAQKQL